MTSRWPPLVPQVGPNPEAESNMPFQLSPTPPVAVGGVVAGKYRIDGVIGFGGMGIVCSATHLELGAPIAIKFVRPERASDDRAVQRFLTEARAAAQLKSQFACRVMDCGRLPTGTPYIVMEHLQGSDLRAVVDQKGPLPIDEAVSFALQACEALAEAHAKHIVHRDVKPENLFLTEGPDGTPLLKVLDFGISKQLDPLASNRAITEPTENMGSPFHMSPEQMIDPASVDSRTDIWALGVVLYEVLTGQLPFSGETTPQLCANVMTTQPIPPQMHRADIPEGLARVIMRCLEKDKQRRYADVAELGLALKEFGGAASSLAAARVERILGRTPAPARVMSSSPELEPESLGDELDAPGVAIPGVPRKGFGLRVIVVLVLGAASVLAVFALGRASQPVVLEPVTTPSAPPVLPPTPPEPSASTAAPPSAPPRPNKPPPRARSAHSVIPTPPVATPTPPGLFPELKPIPDMPAPQEPPSP